MSAEYDPNIKIKVEPDVEPVLPPESDSTISASEGAEKNLEYVYIKTELDVHPDEINVKQEAPCEDPETEDSLEQSQGTPCVEVKVENGEPPEYYVKTEMPTDPYQEESGYLVPSQNQPKTSQEGSESDESEKSNTCPVCQKTFANQGNVRRHLVLHTRVMHNCHICSRQFRKLDQLQRHLARHEHSTFDCQECGKRFPSPSKLKQHGLSHIKEKSYFCKQCHRSFTTEVNLVKHQGRSRCRYPIDEPLTCNVCFKTFEKAFLLKSHLRRHDTLRMYACDLCGMTFKYKSTIVRHLKWHNGDKPFECKVCKKSFTQAGLLKPHMRVHTGERPYQCHICLKTFSYKHNMLRHTARHSKVKRLVCEICKKKFPRESRLIYHMRIHLDEKRFFSCFVCPKKFSHKQNVLRHYMRKHPGHTYDCPDTDAKVALRLWDKVKNTFLKEPEEILG